MAVGFVIGGVAVLGTVTAALASWMVEHVRAEKAQTERPEPWAADNRLVWRDQGL